MSRPYTTIVWGTGGVGRRAIRHVVAHPDLELVGVYVTNPAKVGVDAATLAGLDQPTGVFATDSVDSITDMTADCVLHLPLPSAQVGDDPLYDERMLCQLLASGKNVVTTVGYVYPKAYGDESVARLEQACRSGQSTMHGTGLNPGWMGELLPLAMSGLSNRIDRVYVLESSVFDRYPSPDVVLGMMGFGMAPTEYERHTARYKRWLTGLFSESVWMIADGLAAALDRIDTTTDVELTDSDLTIAAGPILRGTVAAQRWRWTGTVGDRPLIELEAVYRAVPGIAPEWAKPGFVCRIDGSPSMNFEAEHWISSGLGGTAAHAVNSVSVVCDAPPGIRTFLDLPLVTGRHTWRRETA